MPNTPPVVSGALPIVGHIPQFVKDRGGLLKRGFEEQGEIFSIRLPKPVAVVAGAPNPDNARAFFDYLLTPEAQSVLGQFGNYPVIEGVAVSGTTAVVTGTGGPSGPPGRP